MVTHFVAGRLLRWPPMAKCRDLVVTSRGALPAGPAQCEVCVRDSGGRIDLAVDGGGPVIENSS